jgi:pimeloyl-ACP methyl ester carboxylesterase
MDGAYLRELCGYWRDTYDWRAQEAALNRFDHFRAAVDDLHIHFIHQRSPEPDAMPLVLIHGWPGSFVEFHKVIGPLSDPVAHGGKGEDAFHVIVPSLPGFAFSDAPREPGWTLERMAHSFIALMARLGYDRYALQGGDCGAIIAPHMAHIAPSHVIGIHLNGVSVPAPRGFDIEAAPPEEREVLLRTLQRTRDEHGYSAQQRTRPQTLGYALNDSPAGLAAWIVEKFRAWSEHDGNVESTFTRDELLTNVMIYWVTASINSSIRCYCESYRDRGTYGELETRVETPTGITHYPGDPSILPASWENRLFNVVRRSQVPAGGHFAALEQPELFVTDLRAFFRMLR